MVYYLASSAIKALHGGLQDLFISVFLSWSGYLLAHRSVNGVWVDHGASDDHEPNLAGTGVGVLMIVASMVLGANFVPEARTGLTVLASGLFVTGYLTAHYYSTGTLL